MEDNQMSSGVKNIKTGNYTGTGAAKEVALGFAPKMILFLNLTDDIVSFKTDKQADENHTQIAKSGAITQVTTEGVTIPEPQAAGVADLGDFAKFVLGTNAGVNGADKAMVFMAIG
jgi:hypothetical protein